MKHILIKKLALENFKCHKSLVLDFGGSSASIYGDNATGKTSIYDALTWLLFGKDSKGNGEKNIEIKPLNEFGEVRDHLAETAVEAVLLVHVLGGGTDLAAHQVGTVVESNELARKLLHQALLGRLVVAVDDHTVGDPRIEFLYVAGADPNRYLHRGIQVLIRHLGQPLARSRLDALHAKNHRFVLQMVGHQLLHEASQALGADGDHHRVAGGVSAHPQIRGQLHGIRQR